MTYWVDRDDGTKTPPAKGPDGRYHVEGKLSIANKEDTKKMVYTAIPLLQAGESAKRLFSVQTFAICSHLAAL
jgi:hypothetical protein